MKYQFIWVCLFIVSNIANAKKLADDEYFKYEVYFTNPVCRTVRYENPVKTFGGKTVYSKTKNAYCNYSDSGASGKRESSPQYQLVKLINSSETKEVFLSYLSFSNSKVARALCRNIERRNLKVTFIIDSANLEREDSMDKFNYLKACRPKGLAQSEWNIPRMELRGGSGGIAYAHNKILITNPRSKRKMTIVFSSGNMSSGAVLHHENWHFITASSKSYFMQAHLCLMKGSLDHAYKRSKYVAFIEKCRSQIKSKAESDISVYFVPGEGDQALASIRSGLRKSRHVSIAAHRFSFGKLISALESALEKGVRMNFISDDDMFWAGQMGEVVGRNMQFETYKVRRLERAGMKAKYIQTNDTARLLHHNKFLIFDYKSGGLDGAVFAGAGNFTGTAFSKNMENFYFIEIPQVYDIFKRQYDHMWKNLANSRWELPSKYLNP